MTTQDKYGVRIPTLGFLTGGVGSADEGIPPQPYETFAYDSALVAASIGDFNVVPYTSVLPPNIPIYNVDDVKQYFTHGGVLEVIIAGAGATRDASTQAIVTGLGLMKSTKTSQGDMVGGYVVEYVQYFDQQITDADAKQDATTQLNSSITHLLEIRNLTAVSEFEVHYNFLNLDKNHGYCLTCLGFLGFTNASAPSV
ncbi:MAG: pyruvoyl-dependent arginine decarboxylase [Gammaproteobacteria bacterium]|nr:pyruvoyl-dependent arginine decarboxylase [Gammaproteobacteria bacterium]